MKAISNTSPLLFLFRIDAIELMSHIFSEVLIPNAVAEEIKIAGDEGYQIPKLENFSFISIKDPIQTPPQIQALDLGTGETSALALALENKEYIVLLDDLPARQTAQTAGLKCWGTLRILLEAKSTHAIEAVAPFIEKLEKSEIWISEKIKNRILFLAGEKP